MPRSNNNATFLSFMFGVFTLTNFLTQALAETLYLNKEMPGAAYSPENAVLGKPEDGTYGDSATAPDPLLVKSLREAGVMPKENNFVPGTYVGYADCGPTNGFFGRVWNETSINDFKRVCNTFLQEQAATQRVKNWNIAGYVLLGIVASCVLYLFYLLKKKSSGAAAVLSASSPLLGGASAGLEKGRSGGEVAGYNYNKDGDLLDKNGDLLLGDDCEAACVVGGPKKKG